MAQRTNNQTGTGSSSSNSVTQNDPNRHDFVDNCRHMQVYVEGQETICVICQEKMEPTDHTVTHCECNNAFHEHCFDALMEDATDLFDTEPEATKCPMCFGKLRPWPTLGCPNDAVAQADIKAARIEARRAEIEAEIRNEVALSGGHGNQRRPATNAQPRSQHVLRDGSRMHRMHALLAGERAMMRRRRAMMGIDLSDDEEVFDSRPLTAQQAQELLLMARDQAAVAANESSLSNSVLAMQEVRDRIAVTQRITQERQALPTLDHIRSFIPPQGIPMDELVRQLVASTRGRRFNGALLRQLIMTVAIISPYSGMVNLVS